MDFDEQLAAVCPIDVESVSELMDLLSELEVKDAAPNLIWNVLLFGRMLRNAGLRITPSQIQNMLLALAEVSWSNRDDVYYAARATCVSHANERALFDEIFTQFWRRWRSSSGLQVMLGGEPIADLFGAKAPEPQQGENTPENEDGKEKTDLSLEDNNSDEGTETKLSDQKPDRVLMFSPREVLRTKDFGAFSHDELAEARRLLEAKPWTASKRRSRRWTRAKRGPRLDQRRTVRDAMRREGEVRNFFWRKQGQTPRPLVVLCDISGSMDRYTRMLLHFLHTLARGSFAHLEAFVFSTRLTRITPLLRHRDADTAIQMVRPAVEDWGGGTRIGEAIATFNRRWARRVLGRGAVVLIISDGWDRGDVNELTHELAALQRRTHRLIWLNPLLGMRGYQPLTRGMSAALPFIDQFLPIHNIASLEALGETLSNIPSDRPVRRHAKRPALHRTVAKGAKPELRGLVIPKGSWPGDQW